ncbi:hypothetical protein Hanom_Chr11g01012431 [Helianthus anomalus]
MNDKWPNTSTNVSVLLLEGEEVALYHHAFQAHAGVMGVRPMREDEELWYEQINGNFMYPSANVYVAPPTATEGVLVPNPRPCTITPAKRSYTAFQRGVYSFIKTCVKISP